MTLTKVLSAGFALVSTVTALCYMPNGTLADDPKLRACGAIQYSNCCFDWQECTPNGYCLGDGEYYREYCTDPTWQTDKCGNLCLDTTGFMLGTILTVCDDGSFCCGFNSKDCCDSGEGQKIDGKGQVIQSTTSKSSTKTIPSPTTTANSNAKTGDPQLVPSGANTSPSTTPPPGTSADSQTSGADTSTSTATSSGLSTGAKAGIAVGVVAGVLALVALAVLYFRERRKRIAGQGPTQVPEHPGAYGGYHQGGEDAPQVISQSMMIDPGEIDPRAAAINTGPYAAPAVEKYGYESNRGNISELPGATGDGTTEFRRESLGSDEQRPEISQGLR